MAKKITHLSEIRGTSNIGVADMLRLAADEIDSGEREANKAVVLFLKDDVGTEYSVGYRNAGMCVSECLALMKVAATLFLRDMGF